MTGVRASGALRSAPKLKPVALTGSRIPAFETSGGFSGFTALGGAVVSDGALVSADAADTLGLEPGSTMTLLDGSLLVGGIYTFPVDGRRPGFGYAVLVPSPSNQLFDQCWLEVWPQSDDIERLLPLTTVGSSTGVGQAQEAPTMQQLNGSLGARFDGLARYDQRITRFASPVGCVAATLLGFVAIRRRRLQLASARHAGWGLGPLLLQTTIETAVWAVAGAAIAALSLVLLASLSTSEPGLVLPSALAPLAGAGGCLVGAAIATVGVREKHVFRYFKER